MEGLCNLVKQSLLACSPCMPRAAQSHTHTHACMLVCTVPTHLQPLDDVFCGCLAADHDDGRGHTGREAAHLQAHLVTCGQAGRQAKSSVSESVANRLLTDMHWCTEWPLLVSDSMAVGSACPRTQAFPLHAHSPMGHGTYVHASRMEPTCMQTYWSSVPATHTGQHHTKHACWAPPQRLHHSEPPISHTQIMYRSCPPASHPYDIQCTFTSPINACMHADLNPHRSCPAASHPAAPA